MVHHAVMTNLSTTSIQTDPRPLFASALDTAGAAIAAVRPDQLTNPTPCAEFDVRELLGHLTGVLLVVAAVGRGEDPFSVPDEALATDDGWTARFETNRARLEAAWKDGEALDRPTLIPWASESGAVALLTYTNEVTVHTWDLATATGQDPAWDPDVLEVANQEVGFVLPSEDRAEVFAEFKKNLSPEFANVPDPFLDAVPVPEDAPLIDRIVAWSGRRP